MKKKKLIIKQRDLSDCGVACLASISKYYGKVFPLARIRQFASTDKKGTNVFGLLEAAKKLGFSAKGVKGTFESLSKIPAPFIAHVKIDNMLNHFIVVYKIEKKYVLVMDPGVGELKKLNKDEFEDIWGGTLVILIPSEEFVKENKKTSPIKVFIGLVKPHKTILFEAFIGAIITTILGLSSAIYMQKIVDNVLIEGNKNLLNLMSLIMIVILIFKLILGSLQNYFLIKTGQKIDVQLVLGYYKHVFTLPQQFFNSMRVGEILSRMGDAAKIRAFVNNTVLSLAVNILVLVFSFTLMTIYSIKIAILIFLSIPLYSIVYWAINKLNKKYLRAIMEQNAEVESHLIQTLNAQTTIRGFSIEGFASLKFEVKMVKLLQTIYKAAINSLFASNSTKFISGLFSIMLLWFGSYQVLAQSMTPGELLSCYALIGYLIGPIESLIGANQTIQDSLIATDRLYEIIDLESEEGNHSEKMAINDQLVDDIKFNNINFRYGARKAIYQNLTFTIPKGKITAIIGESGAGKSTVFSLLQKLYSINEGQILIGQYDINNIQTESLRRLIGVVPQKIDVFPGSIIENIALGDLEPDIKSVFDICEKLQIKEFIENLPNGFSTHLGEFGANLSVGEKQRIAIARALYKKPEILLLDEAMSNIDSKSEIFITDILKKLKADGKTIIIIAHRLSSIVSADQILVMQNGAIVETGKHKELLSMKKQYYNFWKLQSPNLK